MGKKILIFLPISILLVFLGFSAVTHTQNKNSEYISATELKNASAEEVLKIYWQASYNGEADVVKQLVGAEPIDLFQECTGIKNVKSESPNQEGLAEDPNFVRKKTAYEKIGKLFLEKDIPEGISADSGYINESKVLFDRVFISNKIVYKDEAILDTAISDLRGKFSPSNENLFFFKKYESGWKLVASLSKNPPYTNYDYIKYATPRLPCNQ